jgi:nitrate reductase NapAB chaperone NapD
MVVTGLVVKTAPEKLKDVLVAIEHIKKVSITRIMDENKILAIIDFENKDEEAVTSEEIKQIKGVTSISLAYHHFESQKDYEPDK